VTSISTDAANDTGGEVFGVWAVVLAVTDFAAVLAGLVFVVTEGTVERGELAQLVTLELVLAFRNRSSLRLCQHELRKHEMGGMNSPSQ
jgi:hypothetical protein